MDRLAKYGCAKIARRSQLSSDCWRVTASIASWKAESCPDCGPERRGRLSDSVSRFHLPEMGGPYVRFDGIAGRRDGHAARPRALEERAVHLKQELRIESLVK